MSHYKRIVDVPEIEARFITKYNVKYLQDMVDNSISNIGDLRKYIGTHHLIINDDKYVPYSSLSLIPENEFKYMYEKFVHGICGSECPRCGKMYHICGSCGYHLEYELYPCWKGYCGWECALKCEPDIKSRYDKELEDEYGD